MVGDSLNIPNYITAGSPKGLRRLMLLNNLKNHKEYTYFSIQNVDGKWFAWFIDREDMENILTQKETLNPKGA